MGYKYKTAFFDMTNLYFGASTQNASASNPTLP